MRGCRGRYGHILIIALDCRDNVAATFQVSVTNIAWTAITAQSQCAEIALKENRGASGWPNGDFLVAKTLSPDKFSIVTPPGSPVSCRKQAGGEYLCRGKFYPGQIICYLQMIASVTTTFDQDES
jgi:hypothetical protein